MVDPRLLSVVHDARVPLALSIMRASAHGLAASEAAPFQ
jgi:hypothetical protein